MDHNFHEWQKTLPDENFSSALLENPNWENCCGVTWGKSSKKRNYWASVQIKIPFGKQQINFAIWDCLVFHNIFIKSSRVLPLPWTGLRKEKMFIQGEDVYLRFLICLELANEIPGCAWVVSSFKELLCLKEFLTWIHPSVSQNGNHMPRETRAWHFPMLGFGSTELKLSKLKENGGWKRFCSVFK